MDTTLYETNPTDNALVALLADAVGVSFSPADIRAAALPIDWAALRRLARNGLIVRIGRGHYAVAEVPVAQVDDPLRVATAPFADEPHYVSWWAALARHGLTEQDPLTIAVAVRQQSHRKRVLGALRVLPITQSPARFFGAMTLTTPTGPVRIARPEKAIVDSLDRPDLAGGLGEVVKALASRSYDVARLIAIGERYPSRATVARLGYLLEALGIAQTPDLLGRVRRKSEPVRLDIGAEATGPVNPRWRIVENIDDERLRYWASA